MLNGKQASQGFSLLELLLVVSIIAATLSYGAPSLMSSIRNQQLKSAVESVFFTLQQARYQAISDATPITAHFTQGENWCVGLTDQDTCDCQTSLSCTVKGIEQRLQWRDFGKIELNQLRFGEQHKTIFRGTRGLTAGRAGSMELTDQQTRVKLIVSALGRIRICVKQGHMGSYKSC